MSDGTVRRCVECSFVMFPEESYLINDWGYLHPRCATEADLPEETS